AVVPPRRAVAAQPKCAERYLEVIDQDEEIARGVERRLGAQRGQRGAAAVHERRGFEDADGDAGHRAFRRARAFGAAEGGQLPMLGDGVGQEEAGIVARRRVFRTRIAQADDGAQGLLFLLTLRLLLGFWRSGGWRPFDFFAFLTLADLA